MRSCSAIFFAASGVWQVSPAGMGTPYCASNCLAWYPCIFMDEAHEALAAVLVFGGGNEAGAVVTLAMDFFEHFEHGLVGAAVERSPERANSGRGAGKEIGPAGSDHSNGGSGTVLLVIGVQDENQIERFDGFGLQLVILIRHGEHHVEEVRRVFQIGL